jgi:MFS family permease
MLTEHRLFRYSAAASRGGYCQHLLQSIDMNGNSESRAPTPRVSYRDVTATDGWWLWFGSMALVRLPVTMAPLVLVLFGGHVLHSYVLGGLLAASHAFGEAVFGPLLGRRLDRRPMLGDFRIALLAEAALFAALASTQSLLPLAALAVIAFLAGGSAAGVPGGMRALMASWMQPEARPAAMSLESSLNQAMWAAGPALAALIATSWAPQAGLAVIAAASATPGLLAHRLRGVHHPLTSESSAPASLQRMLRLAAPALLLGGGIMYLSGTLDITLPPRLAQVGLSPALAGPLLSLFAVTSIIGGLLYGLRTWPGSYRNQGTALLICLALIISSLAFLTSPWAFAIALSTAGLLFAPTLTARNLALQHELPERFWASGFSALYASGGVGYGISGYAVAGLLDVADPPTAIVVALLSIGAIITIASLLDAAHRRRTAPTRQPLSTDTANNTPTGGTP